MNQPEDNNKVEEAGAAIDQTELDAVAIEAGADEAPESAGELMETEGPSTAEVLQPLIDLACSVAAPNWEISKGERQALAESYGDLADKYFPEGVGQWGVELNAALITAAIIGPRVASGTPARKEKKREAQPEEPVTDES